MPPIPPPPPPPVTLPSSHPAPPASATDSLLVKSQKFIEEHKLLVLGAAILAVSGTGYYLYSTSPSGRKPRARIEKDSESDEEDERDVTAGAATGGVKSEKKKKKKGSKAKSKKKSATAGSSLEKLASAEDSPLLQERDAEEVQRILEKKRAKEQEAGVNTQGNELNAENLKESSAPDAASATATPTPAAVPAYLEGVPRTKQEILKLSPQERKTLATTLKTRGNKLYGGKKYTEAIACYTKALEVAEKEEAVFYSNRAACYQNMTPPAYEQVVKDCDAALRLDSGYVKALNRRATAFEALGRDEEALRDFTATTIMEKFQNDAAAASVERVLKKIATKKAEEMLATREPRLPSKTFVSAYLGAFRPRTPASSASPYPSLID